MKYIQCVTMKFNGTTNMYTVIRTMSGNLHIDRKLEMTSGVMTQAGKHNTSIDECVHCQQLIQMIHTFH